MKRLGFVLAIVLAAASHPAFAGDIKGKVSAKPGATVVVWVEGTRKFQAQKTRPVMSQRGTKFTPGLLVVVAGQSVDMPNDDNVAHNVFSYSSAKQFNLGIYPKGETKSVTFTQPGLVDIFCSIHRNMNAKILVVPNNYFSKTTAGSPYRISGVPAGKYLVKVWSESGAQQSREVTVPGSGDVNLDFSLPQ